LAVKPLRLPLQTAKPVNSSIKPAAAKAVKLSRASNLTAEPHCGAPVRAHLISRTEVPEHLHRGPPRRGPRQQADQGARSCITKACLGVSRSTPAVRAAQRRIKRGMAVRPSPASIESSPGALRVSHASRLATTSWSRSANAANLTLTTPAPHLWSSAPWVPTLRTVISRTRARLEEPPEPSRSLSVAVAPGAPVYAVPSPRRQLAPRAVRHVKRSPSKPEPRLHLWFREVRPRPGHPSIVSAATRSRP